jgi:hypothetical protein
MMLRERADTAARTIDYYPPESGRDSNGRPFNVDIEDLPKRADPIGTRPRAGP